MATDWGSALGTMLMYYLGNKGGSGETPNFYNIPLSPEQKWREDETKRLYEAGGSPQMNAIRNSGMNFLDSMPSMPTDYKFISPAMQGQKFAGGISGPNFNIRTSPTGVSGYTPKPTTPEPVRTTVDPPDAMGDKWRAANEKNPLVNENGNGPLGPNPGALDGMGGNSNGEGLGDVQGRFSSWWQENKGKMAGWGLNAILTAASAAIGAPIAAIAKYLNLDDAILKKLGLGGTQKLPDYSNTLGNIAENAPGTRDSGGMPPEEQAGNPFNGNDGKSVYNPTTGRWEYTPSFGDERNGYWNAEFFRNLMGGPGPSTSNTGQVSNPILNGPPGGRR